MGKAAATILAALLLAIGSQFEIPMRPVPLTLQTLIVVLAGFLLGWRWGAAAVSLWLAMGAAGLPVFAGGTGGIARFWGPTAGYLIAFPFAAALAGWLAERGHGRWRFLHLFGAALLAHAVCLLPGAAWLAQSLGWADALTEGLWPFVAGAIVKSLLAAGVAMLAGRFMPARAPAIR